MRRPSTLGCVALATLLTASRSDASAVPSVSSDSTCATYPYVNIGYGEVNPFGTCSGHGECVETNVTSSLVPEYECVCDEGWTGRSDWINGDGYDCGVSIVAVRGMWAANLVVTLVLLAKSIPYIKHRLESTQQTKSMMDKKGKKYSLKNNRGLLAVYCFFGICTPAQIIMCVYRIADTHARVGLDLFPTFLFSWLKVGLYMTSWFFSPALLAAVLRGQSSMEGIVKFNDRFSLVLALVAIILGCLPFVNLAAASEVGQDESINVMTYGAYSIGMCVQMILYAIQAVIVRGKVQHELTKSHSMTGRPETLILRARLGDTQSEIVRQATSQMVPYLVLFVFPMLWTKHDYALPLTWIAVPIIGFKVAKSADSRMKGTGAGTTTGSNTLGSKTKMLLSKSVGSKKSKHENTNKNVQSGHEFTVDMGTYEATDEGDMYEMNADGNFRSGVASFQDLDTVPLADHGTAMTSRNPSFVAKEPQASGL